LHPDLAHCLSFRTMNLFASEVPRTVPDVPDVPRTREVMLPDAAARSSDSTWPLAGPGLEVETADAFGSTRRRPRMRSPP
jgi:hypothetical protein